MAGTTPVISAGAPGGWRHTTAYDAIFVGAIAFLSFIPYVGSLGFYSDDWDLLDKMVRARDSSFLGIFEAINAPFAEMRPAQLAYFSLLYKAFGLNPLGYHVVNGIVIVGIAVIACLVLRELGQSRTVAVSIALVYALSPNYAATRFWFAAFAHVLSMLLYGISLYSALRSVRSRDRIGAVGWATGSIFALAIGALCYEVPLPFFLITVFVIWRTRRVGVPWAKPLTLFATVVVVGAVVAFKLDTTRRLDSSTLPLSTQIATIVTRAFDPTPAVPGSFGLNVWHAMDANFRDYGLRLPYTALKLLGEGAPLPLLLVCGAVVLLVFAYLYVGTTRPERPNPSPEFDLPLTARLLFAGFVVFWLGYAIFLTNSSIQFTSTGIANRANIGAALGVAMMLVAVARAVAAVLPGRAWRAPAFCLMIAVLCGSELLIDNVLAAHWVRAYEREREILASIRARIPAPPPGATVLLTGTCPYDGPAIVFESSWDLTGALRLSYGDPSLRAGVATSHLLVDEQGVTTTIYRVSHRYQFGERPILLYDYGAGTVTPLTDAAAARAHLMPQQIGAHCPPGYEGLGSAAW